MFNKYGLPEMFKTSSGKTIATLYRWKWTNEDRAKFKLSRELSEYDWKVQDAICALINAGYDEFLLEDIQEVMEYAEFCWLFIDRGLVSKDGSIDVDNAIKWYEDNVEGAAEYIQEMELHIQTSTE